MARKTIDELVGRVSSMEETNSTRAETVEKLKKDFEDLRHVVLDPVVINGRSRVAHVAASAAGAFASRTKCGWEFLDSMHLRQSRLPDDHPQSLVCERCFPGLRAGSDGAARGCGVHPPGLGR